MFDLKGRTVACNKSETFCPGRASIIHVYSALGFVWPLP